MEQTPVIIEANLEIVGEANSRLSIHNTDEKELVFSFKDKQSLMRFLGDLPIHIRLLRQRKAVAEVQTLLHQDINVQVQGNTIFTKKADSKGFKFKSYAILFSILLLSLKRSILRIIPLNTK
ncbi:MAG: hypothetical protein AAF849_04180 [Bacteroidota bacterium]